MKRVWSLLLAAVLLLGAGCHGETEQNRYENPVQRYYLYQDETTGEYAGALGAMGSEAAEFEEDVAAYIQDYLEGPQSPELRTPFPAGTSLEKCTLEDGTLTLELSDAFFALSGIDRTLATACIVYSMAALPQVEEVVLAAPEGTGSDSLLATPLTPKSFLLFDDSATSDEMTLKLYFSDAGARFLVEETRTRSFASDAEVPTYLVEELLGEPEKETSLRVLPEGTALREITLDDGLVTVDFSQAFLENAPKTHVQARMAVFSLVNTLTELDQVERVQILCQGKKIDDYCGLDLTEPLTREESALDKGTKGSFDTNLYVPCGGALATVPSAIRRTVGRTVAADVLSALLSFTSCGGYENPFPEGTLAVEMEIRNGLCTVTFNSAFALCDSDRRRQSRRCAPWWRPCAGWRACQRCRSRSTMPSSPAWISPNPSPWEKTGSSRRGCAAPTSNPRHGSTTHCTSDINCQAVEKPRRRLMRKSSGGCVRGAKSPPRVQSNRILKLFLKVSKSRTAWRKDFFDTL